MRRIGLGQPVAIERRELGVGGSHWKRRLFTGLRLNEGLDLDAVGARYGIDVWAKYGGALQPFVDAGLVVHSSGILRLDARGHASGKRSHGGVRLGQKRPEGAVPVVSWCLLLGRSADCTVKCALVSWL